MRFNHCKDVSYDDAVEYLTAHPEEISSAWKNPLNRRGGSLFAFASKNGMSQSNQKVGCLTAIRTPDSSFFVSECSSEITEAIRADSRIPLWCDDTIVDSLPVFAEWQERLDREFQDKEV